MKRQWKTDFSFSEPVVENKHDHVSFQIAYIRWYLSIWTIKHYGESQKKNKYDKVKKSSKTGKDQKSFDIFFSVNFSCYNQSLTSGRKTKQEALCLKDFEIFLIFLFLKIISLQSFSNSLVWKLVWTVCYTRIKVSRFYLWRIKPIIKNVELFHYINFALLRKNLSCL